jgi:hypothetical protein
MKSKIKNLVFASFVGLTLSSHGATLFNEDFTDNSPSPNMTVGTPFTFGGGPGPATATTAGSFTITSGENNRIYLGTNDVDYSSIDFTFRADVTAPNFANDWSIIFLGMGSSTPAAASYGEPVTATPNLMMALRGSDNTFGTRNDGANLNSGTALGLTATTHGIKMGLELSDEDCDVRLRC